MTVYLVYRVHLSETVLPEVCIKQLLVQLDGFKGGVSITQPTFIDINRVEKHT